MFDLPDLSTLRQCSVLASAAYAVAFLTLGAARREACLLWWAAASASYCLVLIGFELAVDVTGMGVVPLLHGLLAMSTALILAGVRAFDGQRPLAPWMWGVVAMVAIVPNVPALLGGDDARLIGRILLSAMLALAMILFGTPLIATRTTDGTRMVRRIAGVALYAYIPSYALAAAAELGSVRLVQYVALIPMLADQLLLGMANLSLLAIPWMHAQQRLRDIAMRDALTGVWNRAALSVQSPGLLVPGRIVLLVDVDHFKAINDAHGHATGDRVLTVIAAALQRSVSGDFVARMGGDEFVVVTGGNDPAAAAEWLRRHAAPTDADLPDWTLSIGATRIDPDDRTLADAIQRADRLMYRAKHAGRGRIAA